MLAAFAADPDCSYTSTVSASRAAQSPAPLSSWASHSRRTAGTRVMLATAYARLGTEVRMLTDDGLSVSNGYESRGWRSHPRRGAL